ncbi:MAG: aminopeptidase P family protein, partial [Hyphomicrobiales bacterium]|nr:aminopeptidase P family protein [Hyphomicrobiales bacterium]
MNPGNALRPNIVKPGEIDPHWHWNRPICAPGHTAVDFERRVDHDRLRTYRLARARQALKNSDCGALLLFDVN